MCGGLAISSLLPPLGLDQHVPFAEEGCVQGEGCNRVRNLHNKVKRTGPPVYNSSVALFLNVQNFNVGR